MSKPFDIYTEEELVGAIAMFLETSSDYMDSYSTLELITSAVMSMFAHGSAGDEELEFNLRRHVTRTLSGYPMAFERDDYDYMVH